MVPLQRLPPLFLALATAGFTWWLLHRALGLGAALLKFLRRNTVRAQLQAAFQAREHEPQAHKARERQYALPAPAGGTVWLAAAGGLALALVARDALISPVLFLLSLTVGYLHRVRRRGRQYQANTEDVQVLVESFQSVYPVSGGVFRALDEALKLLPPDGPVAAAVRLAEQRHRAGRPEAETWRPLHDLGNPYLHDFLFVLRRAGQVDVQQTDESLRALLARLKRHRQRALRARVVMAHLNGTVRAAQGALLAALLVSLTVSLWREHWLAAANNRLLFVLLVVAGVGMSLYFEQKQVALREEFA